MVQNEKRSMSLSCSKKLLALLRKRTSKNNCDFHCLNCLHSFRIQNKLKSHKNTCENKGLFGIVIPSERKNILEFSQYVKPNKMPYIIYADLEHLF